MNLQKIKEVVFPYGNLWFYIPCLMWMTATAIFHVMFPVMLTSIALLYGKETGFMINLQNPLMHFSANLLYIAFNLTKVLVIFIILSMVFDGIEQYKQIQRNRGYL